MLDAVTGWAGAAHEAPSQSASTAADLLGMKHFCENSISKDIDLLGGFKNRAAIRNAVFYRAANEDFTCSLTFSL